jgi:hypothetical protein
MDMDEAEFIIANEAIIKLTHPEELVSEQVDHADGQEAIELTSQERLEFEE